MSDFSVAFRLSLQRALWGMLPANLQAVAIGWEDGQIGTARFIFVSVPGAAEHELIADVETEVIADFDEAATFIFTSDFSDADHLHLTVTEKWWAIRKT